MKLKLKLNLKLKLKLGTDQLQTIAGGDSGRSATGVGRLFRPVMRANFMTPCLNPRSIHN